MMRSAARSLTTTVRRSSRWSKIPLAPRDAILGLNEAFKADTSKTKVNLGVGAYRDDTGKPYILKSVATAEKRVIERAEGHEYAGIAGVQEYIDLSLEFAYGKDSKPLKEGRIAGIQTLSGTGACRVFGQFLGRFKDTIQVSGANIYMPDPTWGNHIPIMRDSGLVPSKYRYFDSKTCGVDFKGMIEDIGKAANRSIFMLHACAHNPTGCDPTQEQWNELSHLFLKKNHVVFFDCAYQGFASGDSELDSYALRRFVADGNQIALAQSFAKNFGLYGERVGTFSIVTSNPVEAEHVNSQLKALVRPMYSNPPIHGARIIAEVLRDNNLKSEWEKECKGMARRIQDMRNLLRKEIERTDKVNDWSHITKQIGMFCYTGLTPPQVDLLTKKYSIYLTSDGRISMTGVNSNNVAYVAQAISAAKAL